MILTVSNITGFRCMTSDEGQKLYEAIRPALKAGDDVVLDFSGVSIFSSPFFNFGIGQLYRDISSETLNAHLKIENLVDSGRMTLQRVIKNSKDYYTNPTRKQAVDKTLKHLSEES